MGRVLPAEAVVLEQDDGSVIALTWDPEDVESFEFATPRDVHDVTPEGATSIHRKLGLAHLTLTVHFKEGKIPQWKIKE